MRYINSDDLEPITDDNFLLFCAKRYDGRYLSSTEDFEYDLNRIKYIKKLITRYEQSGELKERLILNHIIVLNNVFGASTTCRILYFKLNKQFKYIIPFLQCLGIAQDYIYNINNVETVSLIDIETCPKVKEALKKL